MMDTIDNRFEKLRQKAEEILSRSTPLEKQSNDEVSIQELFHEISVYQTELEHQNDELNKTNTLLNDLQSTHSYLFNEAPIGYLTIDARGFITRCNQTFANWVEIEIGSVINQPFSDFILPEDTTIFLSRYKAIINAPEEKKLDLRFQKRSGASFYGQLSLRKANRQALLSNLTNQKNEELLITITDITSRKEIEKRLLKSEERHIQAQEVIGLGYWELDLTTNKIWGSQGAFQIYGLERKSEFLPYEAIKSIPLPTDRERLDDALENLIYRNKPYKIEYQIRRHDNHTIRTLYTVARLEKNHHGKPIKVLGVAQDITDQKQAQEALRKSEFQFRTLFNQVAVGVAISDAKTGGFVKTNRRFEEIFGYSQAELVNLDYQSMTYKEDLSISKNYMEKLLKGKIENFSIEKRYVSKTGGIIWGEISVSKMWKSGEEPTNFIAIIKDIGERKRIERKIQDQIQFLSILIDTIPSPIFFKDRQGRYTGCNDLFAKRILGLEKDEIIGRTVFDLNQQIPDEHASIYYQQDLQLLETGKVQIYESKVKCANGEIRDFVFNKAVIKNSIGEIDGIVGVMLDITERKKFEEKLLNSEKRYRSVIQTASDAIIMADSDGKIIDWNLGAEKVFQYTSDEIFGQAITQLMPAAYQNTHAASLSYVAEGGEPRFIGNTIETEGKKRDGSEFPIELALSTWEEGENRFFTAIVRDITERKNFEAILEYRSMHDSLTGLFNRTYYEVEMTRLQKSRRFPVSIIVIDVDKLKLINDTKGHQAGDDLLCCVADILKKSYRPEDMIARIGGDEFVVLLAETNEEGVKNAIKRLRKNVAVNNTQQGSIEISISIGSATTNSINCDLEKVFKLADDEMYLNKKKKAALAEEPQHKENET